MSDALFLPLRLSLGVLETLNQLCPVYLSLRRSTARALPHQWFPYTTSPDSIISFFFPAYQNSICCSYLHCQFKTCFFGKTAYFVDIILSNKYGARGWIWMLDFLCSNQSILHLLTITNSYFIRFDVLRKYFSISSIFTIAVVGIRYTGIPKEFNNLSFLASLSCCTFFLCCLPSTSTTKYGFYQTGCIL